MKKTIGRVNILALLVAVLMCFSMPSFQASAETTEVTTAKDLVTAVAAGGEVTLGADITQSITIASDTEVTLDLNGYTLTASDSEDAITVEYGATLTVTGDGTVTAGSAECVAVYNSGTAYLNGGTFTRTEGTSGYVLINHGTMTIDGATVTNTLTTESSLIENSYSNYSSGSARTGYVAVSNAEYPTLTVTSGTFTGGFYNIKNDDGGVVTINGGTFNGSVEATIANFNELTINGGTLTALEDEPVIASAHLDDTYDKGEVTITGGTFICQDGSTIIGLLDGNYSTAESTYTISGGTFETASGDAAVVLGPTGSSDITLSVSGDDITTVTTSDGETMILQKTYSVTLNSNLDSSANATGTDLTTYTYGTGATLPTDWTADGYLFSSWNTASDGTGDTVTAIGTSDYGDKEYYAIWTEFFTDVTSGQYYYDPVVWAFTENVAYGTTSTTFSPSDSCTRAQFVTFLYRLAGSPDVTVTTTDFTDIDEDAYYYNAVLWAVENNITSGTSTTTFDPNASVTRAQAITFLYRYADTPDVSSTSCDFTDVSEGAYYYNAVLWGDENGIAAGTTETTFSPSDSCTRAQAITFMYRYAN